MPLRTLRRVTDPTFLFAVILGLVTVAELHRFGDAMPGIDFFRAWTMAQAVGVDDSAIWGPDGDPYSIASQERLRAWMERRSEFAGRPERLETALQWSPRLELTGTPFLYSVLRPLSLGTYESDYRRYRFLCLGSTLVAVGVLCRLWGYSWTATLLWLAILGQCLQPFRSDLRVANVNQLQLAQLAVYLLLARWARLSDRWPRGLVAGAALGLAVAFKPNLALVPPLVVGTLAVRRRWREALFQTAGLGLGCVFAWAFACWSFGSTAIWWQWLRALGSTPDDAIPLSYANFAPIRWIAERWGSHDAESALTLLPALAALLAVAWILWRLGQRPGRYPLDEAYAVACGAALFLLISPLAWLHYFLLTSPLFLLLWRPHGESGRSSAGALRRGPALLAVPAFLLVSVDVYANLFGLADSADQAGWVVLGLLLLLAAGSWSWLQRRTDDARQPLSTPTG